MQLQPIPALRTHQMEGSHIVSYRKKVCCVFGRCNHAVSDYKKKPVYKQRVRRHSRIHSIVHSVIHLTNFVMAIHRLMVKQEDKFPTTATQPVLQTLTATDALSFRKYQGMWHMMYSRQRGDTLYHCPTCRLRETRYSSTLRWTNLKLYGINRDKGMWLWKSTLKPEIYSDDATYLQTRNSERRRGEFKGTRWKHHVMKTGPNIYSVNWTLHKPGWLCNNTKQKKHYIKSRHIIRMLPK